MREKRRTMVHLPLSIKMERGSGGEGRRAPAIEIKLKTGPLLHIGRRCWG
jgi:hypothetical protein